MVYLAEDVRCKACPFEEFDGHVARDGTEAIRVSFFEQLAVCSFLLGCQVQVWVAWMGVVD